MMGESDKRPSRLSPAIRAAFLGLLIILVLVILDLLFFQKPVLIVYPVQVFLYILVGRIAGSIAQSEDANAGLQLGMGSDLNFPAMGGMAGLCLCLGSWLVYGVIALGLELAQLGGVFGGVFGLALCLALDLPLAIGLGALGGKMAESH
jgi:hypothetical protein